MNAKERGFIVAVLAVIMIMVTLDLIADAKDGITVGHFLIEGLAGLLAAGGIFFLMKASFLTRHKLEIERSEFSEFKIQADQWRLQAKKYLEGLSQAIDHQLSSWHLSTSEKEVAFLLLKGLSLKEIAEVRSTTEKTARAQSMAVYAKAGLSGRSELAAFFLEDLLLPMSSEVKESAATSKPKDTQ